MIHIVGIGYKPLTHNAVEALNNALYIVTSPRLEEVFRGYAQYESVQGRIKVIVSIEETLAFLKAHVAEPVALLASGDCLFHGIGRRVIDTCGADNVSIYPELSSIQVACSRIKVPWDDALLISLHGGLISGKHSSYVIEDLPHLLKRHHKIAILTDSKNNPQSIAGVLRECAFRNEITVHVCQRLGYVDEETISGTVDEIAVKVFREPNVVIILRKQGARQNGYSADVAFGLSESEINHREGLISKDEVRAVALHRLRLPKEGIMWDIGAGSGSVSIEAANMFTGLRVYAIEKDPEQCRIIRTNIERFGLKNVTLIEGNAPEALLTLPSPQRVFIGGSSRRLAEILTVVNEQANGELVIVITASMLETLQEGLDLLGGYGFQTDCSQLNVSRLSPLARGNSFKPLNPVFILRGVR